MRHNFQKIILFALLQNIFVYSQDIIFKESFSSYWQQHVDYKMDVDMDVENYRYSGKQTLVYTNNSPDILENVYYHLYFNAFQPNSEMDARLQNISDPDGRMIVNKGDLKTSKSESKIKDLKNNEIGFIQVLSLKQNGKSLTYSVEGTILEVKLQQPILTGEKAVFEMEFEGQVPNMIRRSGRNNSEGVALSMGQWYPKMAEYDSEGWHADPYIMREFYGVWGNFDVTINIDKNYILGGTGNLVNPQEIGYGYENKDLPLITPKGSKYKWHFVAKNVHDFNWAADKNYKHDIISVNESLKIHFLYKDDLKIEKRWKEMQPYAIKIMQFYNNLIGTYPYDQYSIIQAGDGGMEYGMCTFVSKGNNLTGLVGLIAHEMGHSWFQFTLATNESKHAWMDEGFTTFIETLAMEHVFPSNNNFPFEETYAGYYYMVDTGQEEPLTTHSDRYKTNLSYSINSYSKGSVFLSQLAYIVGWEQITNSLKQYYIYWKGKHPTPQDFIKIVEKVSQIHLDWYLNEFAQTTHSIDYAVKSVDENKVTLERIGSMPMPIELDVTYIDDSHEFFYIPLNLMRGEKTLNATKLSDWGWGNPNYTFKTSKKIKEIKLEPSLLMADINRKNNYWKK